MSGKDLPDGRDASRRLGARIAGDRSLVSALTLPSKLPCERFATQDAAAAHPFSFLFNFVAAAANGRLPADCGQPDRSSTTRGVAARTRPTSFS